MDATLYVEKLRLRRLAAEQEEAKISGWVRDRDDAVARARNGAKNDRTGWIAVAAVGIAACSVYLWIGRAPIASPGVIAMRSAPSMTRPVSDTPVEYLAAKRQ